MTQPESAVGGEPIAPELTAEDRLNAAFDDATVQEDELPPVEGEEAELTEDDIVDEAEADDLPPIAAPVSWDDEAKAVFADLPRAAQEIVTKREAERERFVQQKSQEATRARSEVEQAAIQQLAQIERGYAEQAQQYAQLIEPVKPDIRLLVSDDPSHRAAYAQQQQVYEYQIAQQQQLQQQAQTFAQQATERERHAEQAEAQQQHQLIVESFPEYLDPTQHAKINLELTTVAKALGFPTELIAQARAHDILAMRTASEWKAKADKLDKLEAAKMQKVRAAKGLPKVSTPGTQRAPGAARQAQYASDRDAMRSGDKDATQRVVDSFFSNPK